MLRDIIRLLSIVKWNSWFHLDSWRIAYFDGHWKLAFRTEYFNPENRITNPVWAEHHETWWLSTHKKVGKHKQFHFHFHSVYIFLCVCGLQAVPHWRSFYRNTVHTFLIMLNCLCNSVATQRFRVNECVFWFHIFAKYKTKQWHKQ